MVQFQYKKTSFGIQKVFKMAVDKFDPCDFYEIQVQPVNLLL